MRTSTAGAHVLAILSATAALTASAGDPPAPASVVGPPAIAPVDSGCGPAVRWLLARQRTDGSFGATTTRLPTTAFVVIALSDERAAPRTPRVREALRRSVEFIVSRQLESGAFVEAGVDHTTLALLALVALRDGAAAAPAPAAVARAALPLLPRRTREALDDPARVSGDGPLVRAAWALAIRE